MRPKESSLSQEEQQKSPTDSSFLPRTELQDTSPLGDYGRDLLDARRYGKMTMMPTPGYVSNNRQPYSGTEDSNDSSGLLIDSGTSLTSSTGSSQQVYGEGYGTDYSDHFGHSYLGTSGLLGYSGTLFTSSQQVYDNLELSRMQGEGYDIHSYNPFGHQGGVNIPSMSSQKDNGGLLGDTGVGYGRSSYNPYGFQSNIPDIASMNPHMTHIGQSNLSSGQYGHMMHNNGNLYGAPTTASFQSASSLLYQELQKWTIKITLSKDDMNHQVGLNSYDVETHIKPHISQADFRKIEQGNRGLDIKVLDQDTNTEHKTTLVLRGGFYMVGNWWKDFVQRRQLKIGHMIGLLLDTSTSPPRLQFRVLCRETKEDKEEHFSGEGYNPFGHQSGGNIPYRTSQGYSGGLLGDSGEGYGRSSYNNPSGLQSNFLESAPMNLSGGVSPEHMMQDMGEQYGHNHGNLDGATPTTSASLLSNEELQKWTIRKILRTDDVSSKLRLIKKDVETHIKPHISQTDYGKIKQGSPGLKIKVLDQDTNTEHEMCLVLRRDFYLMGSWWKDFVQRRQLKTGDMIGLFLDTCTSPPRLQFRVLSRETKEDKEKLPK